MTLPERVMVLRRCNRAVALVCLLSLSIPALAQQQPLAVTDHLNFDFYSTVNYTDNVFLSSTDQQSQVVVQPRVDFDYLRPAGIVESQITGRFEVRDYLRGAYDTDVIGNLNGRVNWHVLPERLDWVFQDYLTTSGASPIANSTPDSVQLANVAITGPTLRAHFSPRLNGQFDLRYIRSDAQTTNDFDGHRVGVAAGLTYLLSPTSKAGINLATQQARYDTAPTGSDFNRKIATVVIERSGPNNSILLETGYTRLDFVADNGRFSGSLFRAQARYDISPRTGISVDVGRQYTDAADSMQLNSPLIGQIAINSGPSRISITPDIYREQRASLTLDYRGDTWSARLEPYLRDINYLHPNVFAIDTRSRGLDLQVDYRFTPLWSLSALRRIENGEYPSLDAKDDNRSFSAFLLHQFARRWAWRLEYTQRQRDTDLAGFSYRENLVGASLVFRRYQDSLK